jgi:hypothetical protein|nr:DUF3305 domain-containing protein [uncultured Halomonas sp.]
MPSDSLRTLSLRVEGRPHTVKGFTVTQWDVTALEPGSVGPYVLGLQLYMTERAAYRHNIGAGSPRLFVRCEERDDVVFPDALTASQEVAAGWMDGERLVLDVAMPLAIQAWLEAYLVRHGEGDDGARKKKRKGAGRAREIDRESRA